MIWVHMGDHHSFQLAYWPLQRVYNIVFNNADIWLGTAIKQQYFVIINRKV